MTDVRGAQRSGGICGTYAGYQRHRRLGIDPCEPCRLANAEYNAAYRKANPGRRRADMRRQAARQRALVRLAQRHPAELKSLINEEMEGGNA